MKLTKPSSKLPIKEKRPDKVTGSFPIVGIGASAGGLEALEQFLANIPVASGMAYVIIQHLDPTQKGMLPELLQRVTKMKVYQVKDRLVVKPDCVYVIPPNSSMSILKGVLHLFEPVEARGMRLPIDFFMRSLADDQHENSIGVILSGMGSDGSNGLRAIKENNGIVLVQEPSNAKYDSMPQNAINAVVVDFVAAVNLLPVLLVDFLKRSHNIKSGVEADVKDKSSLEKIIILLRTNTGNDFSFYKKNTVYRRIERRMTVHNIDKISSYVHFLQENPREIHILFKELMIGVTNFFRDAPVWETLKETIIPLMVNNQQEGLVLRAWVPGCSTGEEAYSLAIVFKETLEKTSQHRDISLQIFATDLDNEAIETARKGVFSANIAVDVSAKRLTRFFSKLEDGYRVNTEIREMVVFANHNIIMHPPFTKIDILSCRNLLIYMDNELQKKIIGLFYYSINPEGFMVLGSAETLGTQNSLFTAVDARKKIFRKASSALGPELADFPSSFTRNRPVGKESQVQTKSVQNVQSLADQLLLERYSPVGVLVNEHGDIIYISGHTGKYLEPSVGKANMNIFAMLREGLRNEFPIAFRKALMKKQSVVIRNIKIGSNGDIINCDVTIQWIDKPDGLSGNLMIIFSEVKDISNISQRTKKGKLALASLKENELEKELQETREEMQSTLEEMQTSQEELKSTNEELQSTNEELQSTNEELTTSKEEMQSLNEELQTVNSELQSKVEDYSRVNNDMKNLLNSTDIATLFLDKELNVRRFTNQATKIFKLIKSDIGRPLTDIVSNLEYPELAENANEVLKTLVFIQKNIPASEDRFYSVRIMPYRTFDDRIDGLVMTFINLSDLKQVELKLHETEQMNRSLLLSSSSAILKLAPDRKILEFNPDAEKLFGKYRQEVIDRDFIKMFIPAKGYKKTEKDISSLLKKKIDGFIKMEVITARGKIAGIEWAVNILLNNSSIATGILLSQKNKL